MTDAFIRILTPHGLEPAAYHVSSLAEAARYEPEGIYTITNTTNRIQVLRLNDHLNRMEDSAAREGILLQLDRSALRAALRTMIEESGFGDVRFRITVPRTQPDNLILTLEPFTPLAAEVYEKGVRCVTIPGAARRNPEAKTTDWVLNRDAFMVPEGVFQGLLVSDDGDILEGTSTNFYAVLEGTLRTAGGGMLPGIAQKVVFDVAPTIMPLVKEAVRVADIPSLQEAFITSSSRGVVPVIEIDGITLGDGIPGIATNAIRAAYLSWVDAHLETL